MATETFHVKGLDALHKKLEQFDPKKRVATLRKAGREAMKPVEKAMQQGAHEDTGALVAAIGMRARTGSRSDPNRVVTVAVGPINKSVKIAGEKHGLAGVNQKAIAQEFGTARQAADPFIRPALDNNKGRVLVTLRNAIKAEMERIARAGSKS